MVRRSSRGLRVLAGALLANALLSTLNFVVPGAPAAPTGLRGSRVQRWAEEEVEAQVQPEVDDGKALDPSSPVGLAGMVVISLAVLPYVVLAIYSSAKLATTGQAFEPFLQGGALTFTGVVGIAEGVSVVVVFGMVLWSILSFFLRLGVGLPQGPFGILGLTTTLSYVAAFLFASANFLSGLGEENPLRGIELATLTKSPEKLTQVASKGAKLLNKAEAEVERITAEPRAQLEEKLKEVEEKASTELSKSPVSQYKVPLPDIKVPDIKVPDIKVPEVNPPDVIEGQENSSDRSSIRSVSDVCIDQEPDTESSNVSPRSTCSRRYLNSKKKTRPEAKGVVLGGGGDDDDAGQVVTSAALGINIDNPGKISDFYDLGKTLGEGSFGAVFKATIKATDAIRAVKRIPLPKTGRDKDTRLDFLKDEIRVAKLLDHPSIVKLFEVFEDQKCVYMVMELCRDGDLEEHVMEGGLNELDAATVMQQVLRGVVYMHNHRIAHRDLKSENMLLCLRPPAKKGSKHPHSKFESAVRISDFGLSCSFEEGQMMKRNCGTDSHKAPQVYAHSYSQKCDVWACGVIMYYLLSARLPFEGRDQEELHKKIMNAKVTWCQEWMSRSGEAMNLAKQMLHSQEANRLEAAQALKHKWFGKQVPRRRLAAVDQEILTSLRGFRKLNKFRKVSLAVIASMLSEKVVRPGRDLFVYLDKDGDGEVTLTELREAMEELKSNKPTDASRASEEIFSDQRRRNTDNKKPQLEKQASFQADKGFPAFSYTEFLAATFDRSRHSTEAVCKAAFRCFDKDGSGQLEPSELVDGYLLGKLEPEEVNQIMEELDANGDGEIDFHEFMAMMSNQEPLSPNSEAAKAG